MDWAELIVHTTTAGSDAVSDLLVELGATGTMVEDRADIPDPSKPHGIWEIIDPKLLETMPEDVLVHAWFTPDEGFPSLVARLRQRLESLGAARRGMGTLKLDSRNIPDENWADMWKTFYHAFRAGKHLLVKPTWEEVTPAPGDQVIEIDPGMAFGSGTHETTGMCIALLEEVLKGGESVVDVGTGSGILAIAAAMSGAGKVLAVDIDPDAVRVARENAEHNHVDNLVSVVEGNLLDRIDETCDICVANIISDVIISFAQPLMRHIVPGGLFICSGIVRERTEEVRTALENAGFRILKTVRRGEWTAFLCGR